MKMPSAENMEEENLSQLLQQKATDEQILELVNTASAKTKEENSGNLPFHYDVANQASEAVVKALLVTHLNGTKEKDNDGCLPLHFQAA